MCAVVGQEKHVLLRNISSSIQKFAVRIHSCCPPKQSSLLGCLKSQDYSSDNHSFEVGLEVSRVAFHLRLSTCIKVYLNVPIIAG